MDFGDFLRKRCLFALLIASISNTWAQTAKTAHPPVKPKPSFSVVPFDLSAQALRPLYLGHDAVAVYATLATRDFATTKSSFETSAAYADRLEAFQQLPLLNGMTPAGLYAFTIKPTVTYDADSQDLKVALGDSIDYSPLTALWSESSSAGGSYVGSNSFGVKRTIQRVEVKAYKVETDQPPWLRAAYMRKLEYAPDPGFMLIADGPTARRLSTTLRVLLIGSLAPPYATHEMSPGDPTINDPVDRTVITRTLHMALKAVWLYDAVSGEVVKRLDQDAFASEFPIRATLSCDKCNLFDLDVRADGRNVERSDLYTDTSSPKTISLHAEHELHIVTSDFTGELPKWKVLSDGIERNWRCTKRGSYGPTIDCSIDIPDDKPSTPANTDTLGGAAQMPTRVSGGVMAASVTNKVDPVYPPIARAAHVSGAVVLHAIISKSGAVMNLQVISGPEMLRASALDAVQHWTYKPYLLNGSAVDVDTTVTVNFGLMDR